MSKEKGLFYPNGGFKSDQDIRREAALDEGSPLIIEQPKLSLVKNVFERLSEAKELEKYADKQEGKVKAFAPRTATVAVFADVHAFHPNTDHDRFARELQAVVNTPDTFAILNGDMVDGIFWGGESGGEQIGSLSKQHGFLRSLFKELKGRVLVATSGEHDSKWASKTGADPYNLVPEMADAPYVRGVAEVEFEVGDQKYNIVTQHKAKGHSMYNKNHPTARQARFGLQGADVYINSHTHQKSVAQEAIRDVNGSHTVTHVSTGPYKSGDSYGQRQGYVSQNPEEMYGAALRFHADKKRVDVMPDILEAIKQWFK